MSNPFEIIDAHLAAIKMLIEDIKISYTQKIKRLKPRYPWHEAPEWAKYAATDRDGQMWWFEERPKLHGAEWAHGFDNCRVEQINLECPEFAETLETRPDNI